MAGSTAEALLRQQLSDVASAEKVEGRRKTRETEGEVQG